MTKEDFLNNLQQAKNIRAKILEIYIYYQEHMISQLGFGLDKGSAYYNPIFKKKMFLKQLLRTDWNMTKTNFM